MFSTIGERGFEVIGMTERNECQTFKVQLKKECAQRQKTESLRLSFLTHIFLVLISVIISLKRRSEDECL